MTKRTWKNPTCRWEMYVMRHTLFKKLPASLFQYKHERKKIDLKIKLWQPRPLGKTWLFT